MKKQNQVIRQNYEKYEANQLEYYGILMKNGRGTFSSCVMTAILWNLNDGCRYRVLWKWYQLPGEWYLS